MRIAQVSPLFESVPPRAYGGTERVVHYLTEELVRRGHEVTLFASGDSKTSAELVACAPWALRLGGACTDPTVCEVMELETVFRQADRFDVVHFHTGHLHYPTSERLGVPHVTTLHGRQDLKELPGLYRTFENVPVVSISDAQRDPLPRANWQATVHHGLPVELYRFHRRPRDYLAWVGRISPEKRVDRAIEVAKMAGMPLRVAAKVDKADRAYFEREIEPLIANNPLVEFVGEVNDVRKEELIGNARALLFLIDWPEPFGLVMIEAMACGTPVIAWRRGSVPEVIEEGKSGRIVGSIEDAASAVRGVGEIDRARVRACFERRFSAARMAEEYERVYRRLIAGGRGSAGRAGRMERV